MRGRILCHDGRETIKHETASSGVNVTMTPGEPSVGVRSRLAGMAVPPDEQSARRKVKPDFGVSVIWTVRVVAPFGKVKSNVADDDREVSRSRTPTSVVYDHVPLASDSAPACSIRFCTVIVPPQTAALIDRRTFPS